MKFKNPFQSATDRFISKEVEHKLYEKASIDIENNDIDKGVWTKAFSNADGNEAKQKAIYIELIVEHYRDEIKAGEEIAKVLATEAEKAKNRQREEEFFRQQELEEEREAQEEAERIRIRDEQWARDAPQREIQDEKDIKMAWLGILLIFIFAFITIAVLRNIR